MTSICLHADVSRCVTSLDTSVFRQIEVIYFGTEGVEAIEFLGIGLRKICADVFDQQDSKSYYRQ